MIRRKKKKTNIRNKSRGRQEANSDPNYYDVIICKIYKKEQHKKYNNKRHWSSLCLEKYVHLYYTQGQCGGREYYY